MTLIISAALYFVRAPGLSVYLFDVIWLVGLLLFSQYFMRMPRLNYIALAGFAMVAFTSILFVSLDSRSIDLPQAIIILMRFTQMAICANFFYNCAKYGQLRPNDFFVPALIAILIPLWGGLTLHTVSPDMTVTFNRYSGYFGNPNDLALYVVISVPVFFGIMRFRPLPRWMFYPMSLLFFATAAYSLMLSGSNSGMLLFIFVSAISFTGSLRGTVLLALAAVILFLFFAAAKELIMPWALDMTTSDFMGWRRTGTLIVTMLNGMHLDQLGSQTYRNELQEYLFDQQFLDFRRVLLGLGPGQSKYLIYSVDGMTATIHNFYLRLFLEFGLIGTTFFATMAFLTFHRFHWNYTALLMLSGYLLASMGTPALYLPFFWVPLFASLAGLTRAYYLRFP